MRVGFVASFGTAQQVVDMAVEAEEHGWDGWFTWDGVDIAGMPSWDPWALLAAAAVRTRSITLGAMVFALPRRRPWVVAKQAVTVDHLSGGRLVLPVGVGVADDGAVAAVPAERRTLRERAELLDDDLTVLAQAFTGGPVHHDGTHLHVDGMRFDPRPVPRPDGRTHVPVWPVAAFPSERSMARAVRWDGVVPQLRGAAAEQEMTAADVERVVAWVRAHRNPDAGPFDVVAQGVLPDDPVAARDRLQELAGAGATWFVDSRWDPATATPDALLARLRAGRPDA